MFCVTLAMLLHRSPDPLHPIRYWTPFEYVSNMLLTFNLTYTDYMVGGLWTLPLEMEMYLTLPVFFLLGRTRSTRFLFLVWVLAIPLALLQRQVTGRLDVLTYAPCFVAGVLAWKLSLSVRRRFAGAWWPVAFVTTWPLFFLARHDNDVYFRWAFCLGLGLTIPWFQDIADGPLRKVVHTVAKYSYGIYLSHVALIMWTFGLPIQPAARWILFAILAAVVPALMYHLIEHPMIRVGQKAANRLFFDGSYVRAVSTS
jgi:peptidoglycan/LPS O-acetylase OafA/YrhL